MLLQYTEYQPSLSTSTSSLLSTAADVSNPPPQPDITGISSLAVLFLFKIVSEVDPTLASQQALFSPLGGRNLNGDNEREEEEGEWFRVRDDLSGEDEDEREDLQKREDGTLDGENTGSSRLQRYKTFFFLFNYPNW
ncbi:hypothetical protein Vadar_007893 [Vaccinium darrowii]|uniref:Uncharacterized protein n=1 Tax=Vaccinium darrowii TaxID=229202 RepID=A0ACB7ZHN9_9ERIC|nr:hypothetical protein Vadar_007893 [Vaccinium darrowii]